MNFRYSLLIKLILISSLTFLKLHAQNNFQVGVSTGIVGEPNFTSNQKLGTGALISITYKP